MNSEDRTNVCENCAFSEIAPTEGDYSGYAWCHRNAPRPFVLGERKMQPNGKELDEQGRFPLVMLEDWCGEHKPKAE